MLFNICFGIYDCRFEVNFFQATRQFIFSVIYKKSSCHARFIRISEMNDSFIIDDRENSIG